MGTDCMPFNHARGSVTLRAAGSRPYGGVDVICTRQITIDMDAGSFNMVLYSKENHLFSSEQQLGSLSEKSNFLA